MISDLQPQTRLDTAFARFLSQRTALTTAQKRAFEAIVAKVSYQQNQGHNCILLDDDSRGLVLASGLAQESEPTDNTPPLPLVVEKQRLYLHRYWFYEQRLARQIKALSERELAVSQTDALLDLYFGKASDNIDWQREAAQHAVSQAFCVITGGPGTGKTTTVVKILAALQTLAGASPLLIALAAPTGKAAMRLQEAIGFNKQQLPCSDGIKQHIPETVTTLHRLLGAKPASPYFRHHSGRPLVYDVVVVDEASMVDLALMSKLVDALKPNARLILLGDKDQLASVESGAVLADLTQALPNHTVELQVSHRFDGQIKKLAEAINQQQAETAWAILKAGDTDVSLLDEDLIAYISQHQAVYLKLMKAGADFREIFHAFSQFQTLCANRQGPLSVADINQRVEQALAAQNLIHLTGAWYAGRPVIVTQNNASLQLYNGDIGLCVPDAEQSGKLMVFFQRADGSVKKYLPARVPVCETVFAMTIHKSQGSEFAEVLIVLPEQINPVLTKELLYTAITRAKKSVRLVAESAVFMQTVAQKVARITGLADKLA
ncbi:exodeoxyribonuclease V subunit alpha [Methylosoma difficile]